MNCREFEVQWKATYLESNIFGKHTGGGTGGGGVSLREISFVLVRC
jgi:hypothetical protein